MKNKVIFGFIFLFLLSFLFNPIYAKKEDCNFTLETSIELNDYFSGIYVNSNLMIKYKNSLITIYTPIGYIDICDEYNNYFLKNDLLYIVSFNNLYIINVGILSYEKISLDFTINDLTIDEYIYLVGEKVNNPYICVLDLNGKVLKDKLFEESGNASFEGIKKVDDLYLVWGSKDAFFESDYFKKVGNLGDVKGFILEIDKTLRITNEYYFNEYFKNEFVTSIVVNDSICITLKANNKTYLYIFDLEFNLKKRQLIDENNTEVFLVECDTNDVILLYVHQDVFELYIYLNNDKHNILSIKEELLDYNVGESYISFTYDNKVNIYSEYHIIYNNELILDRITYDYDSTKHFLVESYFEKLEFKLKNYEPYHQHMIFGCYKAIYEANNSFNTEINIKSDVIIKEFVNIINGGVYKTGTKLMFFGSATLNNKTINNGYSLDEEGKYELVLTDVNNNKKFYNFEVINDYYKDNDNYVIDVDYEITKESYIELTFDFENIGNLKYILVNDEKYENFTISNNKVILALEPIDEWGYQEIIIEKFVFENDEILINKRITYLTLKEEPIINISSENEEGVYKIIIDIVDNDDTIVDLTLKTNQDISTYLMNKNGIFSNGIFTVKYNLGNDELITKELFSVEGDNIPFDISFEQNKVIITIHSSENLNKIIVNDNNIYIKDIDNTNKIILITCFISSILIIAITLLIMFIQHRKIKKTKRI